MTLLVSFVLVGHYCCDARTRARPNHVCVERAKLIVEIFPHFSGP